MSLSDPVCHPECIQAHERQFNEKLRNADIGEYISLLKGSGNSDERILIKIETSSEDEIAKHMGAIKEQKRRCQQRKYKAHDEYTKNRFIGYIERYNNIIKKYR